MKQWVTIKEYAKRKGISLQWAYYLKDTNKIKSKKVKVKTDRIYLLLED